MREGQHFEKLKTCEINNTWEILKHVEWITHEKVVKYVGYIHVTY